MSSPDPGSIRRNYDGWQEPSRWVNARPYVTRASPLVKYGIAARLGIYSGRRSSSGLLPDAQPDPETALLVYVTVCKNSSVSSV